MNPWDTFWKYELFRIESLQQYWATSNDRQKALRLAHFLHERYPSQKVLDVSCGIGMKSSAIATAGFTVLGTDASSVAINGARQYYMASNIRYIRADWENLFSFVQHKYIIVYNDCFSWIQDLDKMIVCSKQFLQCLKKGGGFYFYAYGDKSVASRCLIRDADVTSNENSWFHRRNQETTKCSIHRRICDEYIDIIYRYTCSLLDGTTLKEEAILRQVYKWTFIDLKSLLLSVGFSKVVQIDESGLCCAYK